MDQLSLEVLLVLLVASSSCVVASGENRTETGFPERVKRDPGTECRSSAHSYWDFNENTCKLCLCPAGKQIVAVFCGNGELVGDPGCEDCPAFFYRPGDDNSHSCHPCSTCDDPDASILFRCTKYNDSVCRCKKGMGMIRNYCVSCLDHPDAEGCPPEPNSTPFKPSTNCSTESPKNDTSVDKQDCTSMYPGWQVGLISAACLFSSSVILISIFILIHKEMTRQLVERLQRLQRERDVGEEHETNRGNTQMQQNGTKHSPRSNGVREHLDSCGSQTQNDVLENREEASGLICGNEEESL